MGPSRVKVNRRIRPQPAREQVEAPADVPRVLPKSRPQIAAPGEAKAPAPAPKAQPAPQPARPAPQQFVRVQQPSQPLSKQDFSYNVPGSHSVSISLPSFFPGPAVQQQRPAVRQQFVPQAPVTAAPFRGSPVGFPATAAPVFAPRQNIPVLTAQQVHPSLSKLDLNTGSYSLTVGGRK